VRRALLALALLLVVPAVRGGAQVAQRPVPPARFEGFPIRLVYVDLRDSAGAEVVDSAFRARLVEASGVQVGMQFSSLLADVGLRALKEVPGIGSGTWELYEPALPGSVVLVFRLVTTTVVPPQRTGLLYTGRLGDFPTLLETPGALLRVQLNGALGAFDDRRAWFGNDSAFVGGSPLFPDPSTQATWTEYAVEAGIHGAFQISRHSYLYGSVTGVGAGSAGQDPWRSDTRFVVALEEAYAGWLLRLPAPDLTLSLSYGKQPWQLNQGFLFSQFAGNFNAAERGASYIAARIALQQSAFAKVRWRKFTVEGFLVDPQEYPERDSGTEYLGVDARFNDPRTFDVGVAYYGVPTSASTYLLSDGSRAPREGLRTINGRLLSSRAGGVKGLQLEAEYAHQWNANFPMSADAWYAQLGYEWEQAPWRPNLSYRFGYFEGDDPATTTYERFDAAQSSGSDNWLQGNILRKAVVNSNVLSHRVRLGFVPKPGMNLTVAYFHLWADELNNLGGSQPLQQLTGGVYGDEVDVTLGWGIDRHLFLLALAGVAFPGSAIDGALGGNARIWRSLQLSLFWNL
jgi:hypothetical protein